MGRFDALTTLDTKPAQPAPLPEKIAAVQPTSKPASMQTSKPVNTQTGLHANLQTGKPAIIEKYSTYLTPACKKGLKRLALETDRKDYEVLIEAVEQYLAKLK